MRFVPKGGFPIIRHNEVRDITADLLTEICHDVEIKPTLQPVKGYLTVQKMEQGWMLKPVDFGTVHFSTLGFSTPTHKVTVELAQCTVELNASQCIHQTRVREKTPKS